MVCTFPRGSRFRARPTRTQKAARCRFLPLTLSTTRTRALSVVSEVAPRQSKLSASSDPPALLVAQTNKRPTSFAVSRREARFGGWLTLQPSNRSQSLSRNPRCAARRIPPELSTRATHTKTSSSRGHDAFVKRTPLRQPRLRSPERCLFLDDGPKPVAAQSARSMRMNR